MVQTGVYERDLVQNNDGHPLRLDWLARQFRCAMLLGL